MKSEARIIIIIPYYGKWPDYIHTYLQSLSKNQGVIDVLFISDLSAPCETSRLPDNLKLINLSFEDLKKRIDQKLGVVTSLNSPYKLCDLKPLYGYIFDDFIDCYEFWGFGDIDLIYGNLSNFLDEKLLTRYDILHFRKKWISGCFTLIRNAKFTNELFFKSSDLTTILTTPKYLGFDETSLNWDEIRTLKIENINFNHENFTLLCHTHSSSLRIFSDDLIAESIPKNQFIKYSNGGLFNTLNKEYMIYHMVTEKRNWYFTVNIKSHHTFIITPFGLIENRIYKNALLRFIYLLSNFIFKVPIFLKRAFSKLMKHLHG